MRLMSLMRIVVPKTPARGDWRQMPAPPAPEDAADHFRCSRPLEGRTFPLNKWKFNGNGPGAVSTCRAGLEFRIIQQYCIYRTICQAIYATANENVSAVLFFDGIAGWPSPPS